MTHEEQIAKLTEMLEIQQKLHETAIDMLKPAIEAEREACAKLAMTIAEQGLPEEMPEGEELLRACEQIAGGVLIADAIRARGQA